MTVLGLMVIPIIDILSKLQTSINLLLLPLGCCKINGEALNVKLRNHYTKCLMWLTDMTEFEIGNFRQQSKYTSLIFQDLMMILLDALVLSGALVVPMINFSSGALSM
jgi:hypothetical protein